MLSTELENMPKKIKIHIINYEQAFNDGILSKFARKMYDELEKHKDIEVSLGNVPEPTADVNHHVNYLPYKHSSTINTLMVTHIFDGYKFDTLKEHLETADMGICMSDDTKNSLIERGLNASKLSTVLPAHDGTPRRCQIVSILTNVYPDGCKRAEMFSELAKTLDNTQWAFRIMGSGWEEILVDLVARGLQCDYFPAFDYATHKQILDSSDYSLYFGVDEGSMGLLDAKNAGLKLIAPNVGFNIDIGVDYPFDSQQELNEIFKNLNPNPVKHLTWSLYTENHLKIWRELYEKK